MGDYNTFSDEQLTDLLKHSDHAAFTVIYDRYWALLLRHAKDMLRDDQEAMDVVQEVFAYLWTKREDVVFKLSLSSYLYSAVRYKVIDLINREKVKTNYMASLQSFIDEGAYTTDDTIRERELQNLIEQEIEKLPKKMREVFELSRKHNLSYKQIAEITAISEGTVKKQIYNAIKQLRTRLKVLFLLFMLNIVLMFIVMRYKMDTSLRSYAPSSLRSGMVSSLRGGMVSSLRGGMVSSLRGGTVSSLRGGTPKQSTPQTITTYP